MRNRGRPHAVGYAENRLRTSLLTDMSLLCVRAVLHTIPSLDRGFYAPRPPTPLHPDSSLKL